MQIASHITVNTENDEFEYTAPIEVTDLDKLVTNLKEEHEGITSIVIVLCPIE